MISTRTSVFLVIVAGLSGCHTTDDAIDDLAFSLRDRMYAAQAWDENESQCGHVCFPKDFEAGFKDGYRAVLSGRDVQPPCLPPRKYWSVWFQSHKGHQRMLAWFEGYSWGTAVANQDAVSHWNWIPTGRMAYSTPMETQTEEASTLGVSTQEPPTTVLDNSDERR
jgi:hypothetical protein